MSAQSGIVSETRKHAQAYRLRDFRPTARPPSKDTRFFLNRCFWVTSKVLAMFWHPVKHKFCDFLTSKTNLFGLQFGTILDIVFFAETCKNRFLLRLWCFLSFPSESVNKKKSVTLQGPETKYQNDRNTVNYKVVATLQVEFLKEF